jgi:glyoxylase-like metal-dependent hydrolase (beta-lactamase superfamily II)
MAQGTLRVHTIRLRMSLAYLVESSDTLLLVDAGMRGEAKQIMAVVARLNRGDPDLIYITHGHLDHYGSAAAVRRLTGAPIAVHKKDAAAMAAGETRLGKARGYGRIMAALLPLAHPLLRAEPAHPDILLEDDQRLEGLGFSARALYTPGHTLGSTCLLVDDRIAFSGDLVTTTGGPHIQRTFAEDWAQIPNSVHRLQDAAPELVYPGHGRRPLSSEALQALGSK